jgi:DNA-binding CsgD family transcriptional regulator
MRGFYHAFVTYAHRGALTGNEVALASPDFHRSRFHAEWLRGQDVLDYITAPLAPTPSMSGGLNIGRPRRGDGCGERELAGLRALRPHLLRACQARLRLEDAASVAAGALAALDRIDQGVVLVDAGAAVVHANRTAAAALGRSDGLAMTRSALACDHADDTTTLRRLVGEASGRRSDRSGGAVAVRRRSGRRPLSVLVVPLRAALPVPVSRRATAMVLVADPEAAAPAPGEALRAAYGLTAAEARTAEALLDHVPLAEMADRLGVTLATVRTLLQRAFDKTDTHSQAELVHLMLAHRLPAAPGAAS